MNWQPIIAGLIVFAAACWICRRIVGTIASGLRSGSGSVGSCGTCSKNPKSATPSASPLVQLAGKRSMSDTSCEENVGDNLVEGPEGIQDSKLGPSRRHDSGP